MPDKIKTEEQLMRVLSASPLQIKVTLMRTASYESKNTHKEHLQSFYTTHDQIRDQKFDALIVTGAPVEQMAFEEVEYWAELQEILNWADAHIYNSLFICWGAQAAIYHYHNVNKHILPNKQFGIIDHTINDIFEPLTTGFNDTFRVPVSRHTEIRHEDVQNIDGLKILADSEHTGLCLLHEETARRTYMFNHLEYDAQTLDIEYKRDLKAGQPINMPDNYYPDNNPENPPQMSWRAHRTLFFCNWLNIVYRNTPYDFVL